jgi:hypothetical protein
MTTVRKRALYFEFSCSFLRPLLKEKGLLDNGYLDNLDNE